MDLSRITIDTERARDGVWRTFWEPPEGVDEPPVRVKLARAGVDFAGAFARATASLPAECDYETRAKATGPILAKQVRGWEGFQRQNGSGLVDIPYSHDEAVRICSDPRLEVLHVWLLDWTRTNDDYMEARRREELEKNSEAASPGA